MEIFHYMVEDFVEVFVEYFFVFDESFEVLLINIDRILRICKEKNLVLNCKMCYFVVTKGIVLGHKVSKSWQEVNKAKIEVIKKFSFSCFFI